MALFKRMRERAAPGGSMILGIALVVGFLGSALEPRSAVPRDGTPVGSQRSKGKGHEDASLFEYPNILLILVDDLGKEWIGCYGAEGIETPRIDALAADGLLFHNAYGMPQCTPTRVTLLTGQYPFRHGWTHHWDVPRWGSGCHFDPSLNPSFPKQLQAAGYKTAAAGKWQIDDFRVEPEAMAEAGFDDWCMWTGGEGGNPRSDERYWHPYIHTKEGSHAYRGAFGPDVFATFLIDFMSLHRDEPFFLYYPMVLTHTPFTSTPAEPHAESKLDRHRAMVRYTDRLVGRLVDALEDLGLLEETIVLFTTDNGTARSVVGRIDGQAVQGAKSEMREAGTALPFIAFGPGHVPEGVETDALVDFTDLAPTLLELAGAERPEQPIDGRSFAPLLMGRADDAPRTWILSMGGGPATYRDGRVVPELPYDDRVIRDRRFKLWIGADRRPERFFDLEADPWEARNLLESPEALDAEAQAALERLKAVAERFPERDAAPQYKPNPPQPWDRVRQGE